MDLMIPSARHKDNVILFLSTLQPDSLRKRKTYNMKHMKK